MAPPVPFQKVKPKSLRLLRRLVRQVAGWDATTLWNENDDRFAEKLKALGLVRRYSAGVYYYYEPTEAGVKFIEDLEVMEALAGD